MLAKEGRTVEWMRLSELYKSHQVVLWASNEADRCTISKGCMTNASGDSDFLAASFNSISGRTSLFEKIFEDQEVNKNCLYRVRIHQTQTSIWKYVIIDDYIPVIVNSKLGKAERYLS